MPSELLPGAMVRDEHEEWHLREQPDRVPLTYTLQARKTKSLNQRVRASSREIAGEPSVPAPLPDHPVARRTCFSARQLDRHLEIGLVSLDPQQRAGHAVDRSARPVVVVVQGERHVG